MGPATTRARAHARDAARTATSSPAFRFVARSGYAALGLVHVLLGILVLVVAFGGDGRSDQSGAFLALAAVPLGFALLWIVAVALWALTLWRVAAGVLTPRPDRSAKGVLAQWGARLSEWGPALVYAALGVIAAVVALGGRPDGEESAQQTSGGVLAMPGGPLLLGLVGAGLAVGGIAFAVSGIRRGFRKKLDIPPGALGRTVEALGVAGYVAKGAALAIVGVLLAIAAVRLDPGTAGGIDGAVRALLGLPFGVALATIVGVGLIAYGAFCGFRARFART